MLNVRRLRVDVYPNQIAFLYKNKQLYKKLDPGTYHFWDIDNRYNAFIIPLTGRHINVINQEVLSKDSIAFRFSMYVIYKIVNPEVFLNSFNMQNGIMYMYSDADTRMGNIAQLTIREKLSSLNSLEINDKRHELLDMKTEMAQNQAAQMGLAFEDLWLRDITFPKNIQDLFSKQLEAKIRSTSDLENARTAVAAARALKNASDIMKDDENIKFMNWLETLTKIAAKGNHTFVLGEMWNKPVK